MEVCKILNTNITNFRKNIFEMLEQIIKFNEQITINTKVRNAVIISEDDYNRLMEALYILSIPTSKENIIEGLHTPLDECLSENEVQ